MLSYTLHFYMHFYLCCATTQVRFDFFCKAALEFLLKTGRQPDILHCHDWSTAHVAKVRGATDATLGYTRVMALASQKPFVPGNLAC
jgi:hypothetical protein